MIELGDYKEIIDLVIRLQDKFTTDLEEYMQEGEGRIALLRVIGSGGENILLKEEGGRIKYALESDKPVHIFKCSEDTFLDILDNKTTVRQEWNLGHFTIEDAKSGEVNMTEIFKWSRAFDRMKGLLKEVRP